MDNGYILWDQVPDVEAPEAGFSAVETLDGDRERCSVVRTSSRSSLTYLCAGVVVASALVASVTSAFTLVSSLPCTLLLIADMPF